MLHKRGYCYKYIENSGVNFKEVILLRRMCHIYTLPKQSSFFILLGFI